MPRLSGLQMLTAVALLLAAGTAGAEEDARSIGGRRVDIRVRERARMQREYEEMRKARAAKLREVREETAGNAGERLRGWRSESYGNLAAPAPEPEPEPVRSGGGVRPIEGTPKHLLYGAVVALSAILVMRLRQRRRRIAVTS